MQTGRKVKILRFDNGGEYKSDPISIVVHDEGIERHFTVKGTPQQNGVVERFNRVLLEKMQCLLSNSKLSKVFWADAMTFASHFIDRLTSSVREDANGNMVKQGCFTL